MLTRRICAAVMRDAHFSCTHDASSALTCTGELQLLLNSVPPAHQRSSKRRRRMSALDSFVDELMRVVVADDNRVTVCLFALPERERMAALYALRLLRDKFQRGSLDQLLARARNVGVVESALIASLVSNSSIVPTSAKVLTINANSSCSAAASDGEIDAWLKSADLSVIECVEPRVDVDVDDIDGASGAVGATQFARDNVYELTKAMAADELIERLEPIRRQLAALVKGGAAAVATFDWLPLLRVVESGADVEQLATRIISQLQQCPIEACAALLTAFANEQQLSYSLASKSAFLELVVAARLCELERVAPRVLVTALQHALQSAHGRACAGWLLAPVLARGGSAQAELVGRVLKEDATGAELCNEFLERFLARDSAVWSDFAFAALQGVLDRKGFRLSSAATVALCQMFVRLAPAHRGSLKFATLLFRMVSKHGADVPRPKLSELALVAQQCDNFMGKAASSSLATLRAVCGEAPR